MSGCLRFCTMKRHVIIALTVLTYILSKIEAINITDFGTALPPELNGAELPNFEDVKNVLKDKCIKESGSDAAYEEVEQATENFNACFQKLIDISALPEEIENAKPNGNLDTVFNKYCNKRNEVLECVDSLTKSFDPCLTTEERDQKVMYVNIAKSLLEFICHENGNQIALFIAEEGPECFTSKETALRECYNNTVGKYFNGETPSIESLPSLIIKEENCRDMDKLETCVVKELEKCKESTPANLVEALFRFVRKETPCVQYQKVQQSRSSVDNTKFSLNVFLSTWLLAILAQLLISI